MRPLLAMDDAALAAPQEGVGVAVDDDDDGLGATAGVTK